jgi:superfamily II DNA/RNA helicase
LKKRDCFFFIFDIAGSVIPSGGNLTSLSFESLSERGVSDLTLKAISEMKLTTMTEIQAKSIGPLLEGR